MSVHLCNVSKCVHISRCTCDMTLLWRSGNSLDLIVPLLFGFWESNHVWHQDWCQASLVCEPSCSPLNSFINVNSLYTILLKATFSSISYILNKCANLPHYYFAFLLSFLSQSLFYIYITISHTYKHPCQQIHTYTYIIKRLCIQENKDHLFMRA